MSVKYILILIILFLSSCINKTNINKITPNGPSYVNINSISKNELKRHLKFIASKKFKGRATGTDELKSASEYLAKQLQSYGYKGLGTNGSFFQKINLYKTNYDYTKIEFVYNGTRLNMKYGEDFVIHLFGENINEINLPLKSISTEYNNRNTQSYDSSKKIDYIPVFFDSYITNTDLNDIEIRNKLFKNGADVVIQVVNDNERMKKKFDRYKKEKTVNDFSLNKNKSSSKAYIILSNKGFQKLISFENKNNFDKEMSHTFKSNLIIRFNPEKQETVTRNVIAYLKGNDPKLDKEHIGIISHYDHMGVDEQGNVFYGANDNGSGIVSTLSIAKTLAQNPPKRSIFIAFHTAEELGLIGSKYFVDHSPIPINNIVSVINLDMVGSNYEPNKVYVVGADRISKELHDINSLVNTKVDNIKLDYTLNERFHEKNIYYRSDHYSYGKKGIPVIFYTSLDPKNYHRPSDTIDQINFNKLQKVTRLAYSTAYHIANQPNRLKLKPLNSDSLNYDSIKKYLGTYGSLKNRVIFRDNKLYVKLGKRDEIGFFLKHVKEDLFYLEGSNISYEFKFTNNSPYASYIKKTVSGNNATKIERINSEELLLHHSSFEKYLGSYKYTNGLVEKVIFKNNKLYTEYGLKNDFHLEHVFGNTFSGYGLKYEFKFENGSKMATHIVETAHGNANAAIRIK